MAANRSLPSAHHPGIHVTQQPQRPVMSGPEFKPPKMHHEPSRQMPYLPPPSTTPPTVNTENSSGRSPS